MTDDEYLVSDVSESDLDQSVGEADSDELLDDLFIDEQQGNINLDDILVSSAHARPRKGIDAKHLSKIWRIDLEAAQKTLDITSQASIGKDNPSFSQNYGTNDRMLRYKRINELLFMDTFFATKKPPKSTRNHACCQFFVTDKGFVYVVLMQSKSEVLQAVKQFAKKIGAPEAIICDSAPEQKSQAVRIFFGHWNDSSRLGGEHSLGEQGGALYWAHKGVY